MRVRQIMTAPVVTVQLPGNRTTVLKMMIENHTSGVPVVDRSEQLVGIVTRDDIFNNTREEQVSMLMTPNPICVTSNTTVISAVKHFVETGFNHLPVVDRGKIVGIITPTNLLPLVQERCREIAVEALVTHPCAPLYQHTPLGVALRILRLSRARALPVLDDRGLLVGILTDRDLFNNTRVRDRVSVSNVGLGEDDDPWTWEGLRDIMRIYHTESRLHITSESVEEIMIRDVVTAFYRTSAAAVAEIMCERDIGQLPLVDSRRQLMGMIYNHDLIRGLLPIV